MDRICLVLPYFGRWPFWMSFFLLSCRHNATIDWLLISDAECPSDLPKNVKFKSISYQGYLEFVQQRLGVSFAPERPYKLCDLKPMYGFLHAEELMSYQFWGFCDLDVIFGDLRSFLTPSVLQHDIVATHSTRLSGHFSLLRNTPDLCEAFRRVPRWQELICDQKNHRFDESAFSRFFVRYKNWPRFIRGILPSNPLGASVYLEEQYSTPGCRVDWEDGSREFPATWWWRDGVLSNDKSSRHFMYFHFLYWKQNGWKKSYKAQGGHLDVGDGLFFEPENNCSYFRIDKDGFHAH